MADPKNSSSPSSPSPLTDSAVSITQDRGKPTAASLQAPPPTSPSPSSAPSNAAPSSPTRPSSPSSSSPSSTATIIPAPEPSYADALRTLKVSDLKTVHEKPCARESLLTGMGAGFGVGGLRFILAGGPFRVRQYRAMSWAVGAFVLTSAGAHAFCQRRRTLEKKAMMRANAIMEEKRRQKASEAAAKRQEDKENEKGGGVWKWVGWK